MTMKKLLTAAIALLATQVALAGVKIEHWVSPSGARVYFVESRVLPMLDVQVDFAAGSMFDPAGKSGLAALTRAGLDLGAGKLDETAIAEQMADIGANLGGGADTDRASVALRTLSARDKRDPALDILRAVLQSPRFDAAIFEREKARTIASLKEALTRPDSIAGKAFWAAMYPTTPTASRPARKASPRSTATIWQPSTPATTPQPTPASRWSATFPAAKPSGSPNRSPPACPRAGPQPCRPPRPAAQGGLTQIAPPGQPGPHLHRPAGHRARQSGLLPAARRQLHAGRRRLRLPPDEGSPRQARLRLQRVQLLCPAQAAGPFQIGLQTKRSQAQDAIKVARDVLDGFLKDGPSPEELAAAKANLTGSFPLRLDSNKKLLDNVAA